MGSSAFESCAASTGKRPKISNYESWNILSILINGGSKNLIKLGEACVLEDRPCTECGECDLCDQDPSKQCDNCGQCIEFPDGDFAEIEIDDILINTDNPNSVSLHKGHGSKFKIKE